MRFLTVIRTAAPPIIRINSIITIAESAGFAFITEATLNVPLCCVLTEPSSPSDIQIAPGFCRRFAALIVHINVSSARFGVEIAV